MAMGQVTIMGAGIFGLSIAWRCLCEGATVTIIDPNGVGAGASGGVLGALAPHVPENWNDKKAFQLESLLMANDYWAGVQAAGGQPTGYARAGRIQPLADQAAITLARSREVTAKTLWGNAARWEVSDHIARPDWAPLSPTGHWVFDTLSARIAPRLACHALAKAIIARGGSIVDQGPMRGAIVHATGVAGLADLNQETGKAIGTGIKGQAAVMELSGVHDQPQIFTETMHIIPHDDGTVALGSTNERDFTDATQTDEKLDDLIARARAAVPALANAPVLERWAGLRPRAKTRAPLLGAYPGRPGHFIANGGFKIGIGMAPKVADVMAKLVLHGQSEIPPEFDVANLIGPTC